jgi:oligoendopeptidase F
MKTLFLSLIIFLFVFTSSILSQTKERSEIPEGSKWNLTDLYPDINSWDKEMNSIAERILKLPEYQGKLGESSTMLYNALKTYFGIAKDYSKAATYAYRLSDEDVRISDNQALTQQVSNLGTKFGETTAFFRPEILEIPNEKIDKFFSEKPELKDYRMFIDNIQRLRKNTLGETEEKILASFGLATGTPSTVYSIFTNAEMPNPKVTLSMVRKLSCLPLHIQNTVLHR